MTGTNIGTGNYVSAAVLKQRGYSLVRLVSLPSVEPYAADLRANGIAVLAMVDPNPNTGAGYVMANADVLQFDNERDIDQSPEDYAAAATFYQRTYPNRTWITCGMSTGNVQWWRDVAAQGLPGFSGFAVHPYNKNWQQAEALLSWYQGYAPDMDLWVTEWERPEAEIPGFQKMLRKNSAHDIWFCEDCGVDGFGAIPLIGRVG